MSTKTLVVGLGESGLAMVRHALDSRTPVVVYDSRKEPPLLNQVRSLHPEVTIHCGLWEDALLNDVSCIQVSPGLSPHQSPLKEIIAAAQNQSIELVGELTVFVRALAQLRSQTGYNPKIIAITGTNGKTTVTSLVRHLCLSADVPVIAAGNISPSMLDALRDAQQQGTLPDVWALELSSFQLMFAQQGATPFNPDAAVVLNISQDHLDWHSNMDEYIHAKAAVYGPDTVCVFNRDDVHVMSMRKQASHGVSFGQSAPMGINQYGLLTEAHAQAMDWLCVAYEADEGLPKKRHTPVATSLEIQRLMPADALRIRGRHNAMNALAALALCRAVGLPMAKLLHGLRDYVGEPHRVQWIGQYGLVNVFDDSKGTNVGASLAAIEGLGQPIVLIAGGDGKGQDFTPMSEAVARHVVTAYLIGKDAALIQSAWAATGTPLVLCDSLEEATAAALNTATAHSAHPAVLLSPACASLDMFKNYAHRAQVFVEATQQWANDSGQV